MLDDLVWRHKRAHEKLAAMSIHEKIRSARLSKGWSMEKFATLVSEAEGLSKPLTWQTVQQWEKEGGTAPKRKRLEIVAKVLGLQMTALVTATGTNLEASGVSDASHIHHNSSPSIKYLIVHLGAKLAALDSTDRKQAQVVLSDLALDPKRAPEMAVKLERLLGEILDQPAQIFAQGGAK